MFSQRWQIIAPRLRQGQKLAPKDKYDTSNPENFLFNPNQSWGAWSKLAKPVDFDPSRKPFHLRTVRRPTNPLFRALSVCLPSSSK
jgi:hypothetical protein